MKKIYFNQVLVIIFAVIICISTVIPAASVLGQSINLLSPGGEMGSGVFLIILSLLTAVLLFFKKKIPGLIFAVLTLLLGIAQFASFSRYIKFAEFGFYLMLIGCIGLFVSAILVLVQVPRR